MTWDAYHRRKAVLRDVVAAAATSTPTDVDSVDALVDAVHGRDAFPTVLDLMFDAQLAWYQRLSGRLDAVLDEQPLDPERAVVAAWARCAAEAPGLRVVLDVVQDEPALQKAFDKERVLLAAAAGTPGNSLSALAHGRRIVEAARRTTACEPSDEERDHVAGLFSRLKDALTAA